MNARMRECLERAVRERSKVLGGRRFNIGLLRIPLALGADGFKRSTIWRALELATEDESERRTP